MGNLNGIPIIWGEGNDPLLESLFPDGLKQEIIAGPGTSFPAYESPLNESVFYGPQLYTPDTPIPPDDKAKYYIIFVAFDSKKQLERYYLGLDTVSFLLAERKINQTVSEFLKDHPDYIVCCYLASSAAQSEKLILLRMGQEPFAYYSGNNDYRESLNRVSDRLVELGNAKQGFDYTSDEIKEAFVNAVPDNKHVPYKGQRQSQLYQDNYDRLLSIAGGESADQQTKDAIKLICQTLLKINYDVLQSYNKQTDVRYNTIYGKSKLTAADILSMNRRLLKMSEQIEQFHNADFKTAGEVMNFIEDYLLDVSAESEDTDHVIVYPFSTLSKKKRKDLLLLLLDGSSLEFSGRAPRGRVVYLLLATAKDQERFEIVAELNASNKIFELMHASGDNDFLFTTVYLVAATVKAFIPENVQPEFFTQAMMNANFIFYDDTHDGAYSGGLRFKEKKVSLANEARIDLGAEGLLDRAAREVTDAMDGILNKTDLPEKSDEQLLYEQLYVSPKTGFDPLELIIFRAESDIKSSVLEMKQDEIALLPACLVYLLFKEREIARDNFNFISTITFLLLPLGVAGLVAAIQAANVLGILVTTTDIVVDGFALAANMPEVQRNDPEFAKTVNTFAFFYGLMRLGGPLMGSAKSSGKSSKNLEDALRQSRKQISSQIEKELEGVRISPKKLQFQQFIRQNAKASIANIPKSKIVANLLGHTEQSNRAARMIEEDSMTVIILSDFDFIETLVNVYGLRRDEAAGFLAFTFGQDTFYRASRPLSKFMSEIVHESSHVMDYIKRLELFEAGKTRAEIAQEIGNTRSQEKRAYFYERQFQKAVGQPLDYENISDIINHVDIVYPKD